MQIDLVTQILSLIDLTSLNETDTEETITALCKKAMTPFGHVAAVCVYPPFVKKSAHVLSGTAVKIATVANFPSGNLALADVVSLIKQSIVQGANEIDVVFPYENYLAGNKAAACDFISACKAACGEAVLLKVILESGAFTEDEDLAQACRDVMLAGADFLKTSTGKIAQGATPAAAKIMLLAIKELSPQLNRLVGFKASGGVRTVSQALDYLALASDIFGAEWITPRTFRFGASQLLEEILSVR